MKGFVVSIQTWSMATLCALGLLLAPSCGPLNEKPADQAGTAAAKIQCNGVPDADGVAADGASVILTKQHTFVFLTELSNLQGEGNDTSPKTGTLTIRVVHGLHLQILSKDTKISVTYHRDSQHPSTHPPYPLVFTRQDDGSFVGTFSLKKTGTFVFDIALNDGSDSDAQTFKLKIQ